MSTAEERLAALLEIESWCAGEETRDPEAVADLAREAIELLREAEQYDLPHDAHCSLLHHHGGWSPGDPKPVCNCGTWTYERKRDEFLDGPRA